MSTSQGNSNQQGRTFIIMEPSTAPTLASIVAETGSLPPERVARIGLQVAFALHAAHRAGMANRNVQPANVIVAEDGGVRLADFPIVRLQGDPGPDRQRPCRRLAGVHGPGAGQRR